MGETTRLTAAKDCNGEPVFVVFAGVFVFFSRIFGEIMFHANNR